MVGTVRRARQAGRLTACLAVIVLAGVNALVSGAQNSTAPAPATPAVAPVTTPRAHFGFEIGADYVLATYSQYVDYLRRLDGESPRLSVADIGPTAEGRREYMAIITSPANHARLSELRDINRRLALAEGLTESDARQLASQGKAVVWIDGGLHANEVLGAQQIIETVYQLTSRNDAETRRILDEVIVLCTIVNPDGMELVSNWYMRDPVPQRRSAAYLPRLYQKYVGHDNNRDFYMMTQVESTNANRVLYREWFPVIMFDHHQTGPNGAVLFAPPFRDPFNYHFDPLIPLGIDLVGAAIHSRFAAEGKPGAVMRSAAPYSTWFNGGIRTTAYFHNQIGLLTETIGSPTPVTIPFVPDLQLPRADVPYPIAPQAWHFRQSIEYSVSSNYAVLDLAAARKETFLVNMYLMGQHAIEKGSRDTWTVHPSRIEAVVREAGRTGIPGGAVASDLYARVLHHPDARDPRGFIVDAGQPDFLTATKFVNALIKAGVQVHRATAAFSVAGKSYPAGSYVVKTAQAFRAHVMDMFEPQDYPHDVAYPGGPPVPPYDVTGYNLAYSMGIDFDRVREPFDAPLALLIDEVTAPPQMVAPVEGAGAYVIRHEINDAFVGVNRLLRAGQVVARTTAAAAGYPPGTFIVPASATAHEILTAVAREKGVPVATARQTPAALTPLRRVRIGLWDRYGGSIPSGWTRWLLEQFEFPFEIVYPKELDAGDPAERFDVLLFVDGAIPANDRVRPSDPPVQAVPAEFRDRLGGVSVAATVPRLRRFVERGGTLIAIGSSTAIAAHLGLPVVSALVDTAGVPLPRERFYIPGSLLEARVDNAHRIGFGMRDRAVVVFDQSHAFRVPADAATRGISVVAWFDGPAPLRSGWAWGQQYLDGAAAVVEAKLGTGSLVLFGPEVAWRAQPHGTFKLLFNAIYANAGR